MVDGSSAAEYDPVANVDLAVTVTDDDTAGITVTAADPFTVGEGGSKTYTVKLNSAAFLRRRHRASRSPAAQRGDHRRHRHGDDAEGVQNTLTFTASDWDTPPDGDRQRG